jgi:hypothetical protein
VDDLDLLAILDGERAKLRDLSQEKELLAEITLTLTKFVFHAESCGWINRHERDVLLDLRDDGEALRRLTS